MSLGYIGSKKSLLKFINYAINDKIKIKNKKKLKFGDLFAGTNIVGEYIFNKYKMNILSNDLERYSFVIGYSLLKCSYTNKLKKFVNDLKDMEYDVEGLIYQNYSPGGKKKRKYWTEENAKIIDTIRQKIEEWKNEEKIFLHDYYFLLASLLVSADKVANTASVYGAFLKEFKQSAQKKLDFEPIHTNRIHHTHIKKNIILNIDVNEINNQSFDIVYLDPPYNNRQYSANYFPLNYIVEYDSEIKLRGKTGIIDNNNISKFCQSKFVKEEFDRLIDNLDTKHIFLSYNNEGLLDHKELTKILNRYGDVKLYKASYKKFINSSKDKVSENERKKVYEYLFHLQKNTYTYEEEEVDLSKL